MLITPPLDPKESLGENGKNGQKAGHASIYISGVPLVQSILAR